MKTILENESASDSRLVELCLRGDRRAFERIVSRYQSIICAVAYSACGDVGRSEDLAQDTFIAAWRKLGDLKEPEKLKSWLCGIARNLVNNSERAQQRVPTARADELPPETCSPGGNPHEMAVSNEEEALMWRALETIPADYREPMVLYYREAQSVEKVAAALELSQEAVRQRLSRGRVMLNERVAKTVESALSRSAPGRAFTIAVLAALPALVVSTKAAAAGAVVTKGSASAKAVASMGAAGALLAPLLAFFGTYASYRYSMESARSPESRDYIRKFYRAMAMLVIPFAVIVSSLAILGQPMEKNDPVLYARLMIGVMITYAFAVAALIVWAEMARKRAARASAGGESAQQNPGPHFEYRSRLELLGIPLVHIRFGCEAVARRRAVVAWFAAGDVAIGAIFAFGGVAIAPVSLGGVGAGLMTFGGFALGLASMGGFALGVWVFGGLAAGWFAFGGCALGAKAAVGGVAAARSYAVGGAALAAHANDAVARAFVFHNRFFRIAGVVIRYVWFMNLFWLFPFMMQRLLRRKKLPA
ncbi:MAG TPA: RNA polymerase sigma factor [Chthoniobacteraceae bacterium]|nr:RNA polymerase sigma factor [Chthoniobacteraceae bacterium]